MTKFFIIERKTKFLLEFSTFLRMFYMPIIGLQASSLYSVFNDLYLMSSKLQGFEDINLLTKITLLSENEIKKCLKKLEAVGLVRTFESADNQKTIISMIDPLRPEAFRKNSLLYKMLIDKIDESGFEKVEYAFKEKQLSKDEYKEVTVRFQDIFSEQLNQNSKQETTLELPLIAPKSKEEAIKGLTAPQFVMFLTNTKVTPLQLSTIQRIQNWGMSNEAINIMINYVFDINGTLVAAHLEKIAKDMFKKDIPSIGIASELANAKKARNASYGLNVAMNEVLKTDETSTDDSSWEDLFKSLGGEL